jgi:hypothetical protein
VEAPKVKVSVPFPGVVQLVAIRESGPYWTWIFGEGMEEQAVGDQADNVNKHADQSTPKPEGGVDMRKFHGDDLDL